MEITTSWVKVTTVAGNGVTLQKHGLAKVRVAYSATTPVDGGSVFILRDYSPEEFLDNLTSQFVWARTVSGTITLGVEEISSGVESAAGHASAHFSDSTTQTIAIINTPQDVKFNTHDDTPLNITHDTVTDNHKVSFDLVGRYALAAEFQVHNGSGSGEIYAWAEESLDDGSTWTAIANSAVVASLSANTEGVLTLTELYDAQTIGDSVKFRIQGDSLNIDLDHRVPSGAIPAVPSVMLTAYLVGESS